MLLFSHTKVLKIIELANTRKGCGDSYTNHHLD